MFSKKQGELSIPPQAARARDGVEIARIWIAGGSQHVALRADVWEDRICGGI